VIGPSAAPPAPPAAARIFGSRLELAERYAALLAGAGVERGLLGPREADRLWSRHLLNCAVAEQAIPAGVTSVVDIGSGAGLPGVPVALARPDLQMTLLEPMERRIAFLTEVRDELGISLDLQRARAEEGSVGRWEVVLARAVAPLERLLVLAAPLVQADGMLVAIKGRSAAAEVATASSALRRHAAGPAEVLEIGDSEAGATVVRVPLAPAARSARAR
jgi:16S rRNA (guanine527-N7)-methyltransferase